MAFALCACVTLGEKEFPVWGKFLMNPLKLKEDKGKGRLGESVLLLTAQSLAWRFLPPLVQLSLAYSLSLPTLSERNSKGESLVTGGHHTTHILGTERRREWPFSVHPLTRLWLCHGPLQEILGESFHLPP